MNHSELHKQIVAVPGLGPQGQGQSHLFCSLSWDTAIWWPPSTQSLSSSPYPFPSITLSRGRVKPSQDSQLVHPYWVWELTREQTDKRHPRPTHSSICSSAFMPASFISHSKPQEESSGADLVPENSLVRSYSLEDFHEYWQEALLAEKELCKSATPVLSPVQHTA